MKMVSLKSHRYGGRKLSAGDTFECGATHRRVLVAIGAADDAPPEPVVSPEPKRRAPAAEKAPEVAAEPVMAEIPDVTPADAVDGEDKPKRAYKRRDMAAE